MLLPDGGASTGRERHGDDIEKDYELTVTYGRFLNFEVYNLTPVEESFPVFQKVYG